MKSFYQWDDILERTLNVYESVKSDSIEPISERVQKFWNFDIATGTFFLFVTIICHILYIIYSYLVPESNIDIAPEFVSIQLNNKKKSE